MERRVNTSVKVGALIYVAYLLTDKFVVRIPYMVAIPVLVLGVALMITGIIKTSRG